MGISIYTDGASRGNPGEAATGAVVFDGDTVIAEVRRYLGQQTNNFAEYEAVYDALLRARELDLNDQPISFFMDSKLVAEQLSGNWKIKEETLKKQHAKIIDLLEYFGEVTFTYVPREENTYADRLANDALDEAE